MNTKPNTVAKQATSEVAAREEAVLAFWQEHDIFTQSLNTPAGADPVGDYVFYDGPPFATGLPHYGHLLASTIKDAVPRFFTMQGYRVRRHWGWDCHGLPLENLIEKQLGLATKRDIEAYGIKHFNEAARTAVLEYADDWREIIPRMGRFVDMENDYRTMDPSYTESVWWVFKQLHERGHVYEGFKSMHLCPRCGTTLSNFEVNSGYQEIKDISVYVALPLLDETGSVTDTSLLVWTTTPWTLPGNLAAAVHSDYTYVTVRLTDNTSTPYVVLAKEQLSKLDGIEHEVVAEYAGSELVGRRYQPPFPYLTQQDFAGKEHAWQILHADYVELGGDGTGAVHLAPAYGEDDLVLAQSHDLPIVHHVDESGRFKDFVTDFAGQLVKPKDDEAAGVSHLAADIEITKALNERGVLIKKENLTHSYPHCWRCDTPLLNYATTSWFVAVSQFRDRLVTENSDVHWVPEHVGKNRFGKWLEGARDWAVSRQRYWGAPLPVWKHPETGAHVILGSLADLQQHVKTSGNTYHLMRHGESVSNIQGVANRTHDPDNTLTDNGREQVRETAAQLRAAEEIPTRIYTSPLPRTKESALLLASELGLDASIVVADERLLENGFGDLEGEPIASYEAFFAQPTDKLTQAPENGETWHSTKRRTAELLFELEQKHENEVIMIVSHRGTLEMLQAGAAGMDDEAAGAAIMEQAFSFTNAEWRQLTFTPFPHNEAYELDFHRPYIDQITLYSDDGAPLTRVEDVFDCWFESGSMPYAQHHYPFENEAAFTAELFPANFIAEGLDQTRGWFYSLIVLGVALFGQSPFQNVIVNGLVLAEDGRKMSKSKQNYPDPLELVNRYGADTMRFYMLSSAIMHGEDLHFSEKEVAELQRKNIGRLHNVLTMYEQYANGEPARDDSPHVLDQWIIARLAELIDESTTGYQNYELDRATRPVTEFIDDLSVWYLRRSRDRLKGEDADDKQAALATLRYVLTVLSQVMAPVMPFYSEYLWGRVRDGDAPRSVHLSKWPKQSKSDTAVLQNMSALRLYVSAALQERAQSGVKVRQPLASMTIPREFEPAYIEIMQDEVNVKQVQIAPKDTDEATAISLDLTLTPELQAEGEVREFMRGVQGMRKTAALEPDDVINVLVATSAAGQSLLTDYAATIQRTVGARSVHFHEDSEIDDVAAQTITTGEHEFTVLVQKL